MDGEQARAQSRSVLIVAVAAVAVLVVVTVVALAVRSPTEFEPGTPEATAQGYVQAVVDDDATTAIGYLSEALKETCTPSDFRTTYIPESLRVTLSATAIEGETAEVDLNIEEGGGGLGGSYDYDVTLYMARQDGAWVISEPPWPIEFCGEEDR